MKGLAFQRVQIMRPVNDSLCASGFASAGFAGPGADAAWLLTAAPSGPRKTARSFPISVQSRSLLAEDLAFRHLVTKKGQRARPAEGAHRCLENALSGGGVSLQRRSVFL